MPLVGSRKRKLQLQGARTNLKRVQPPVEVTMPEPTTASTSTTPSSSTLQPERPVPISASKAKLSLFPDEASGSAELEAGIVQFEALQPLFQNVRCTQCCDGRCRLSVCDSKSYGLAVKLEVVCEDCGYVQSNCYTSMKCQDKKNFDINRRTVAASLATGLGHAGMGKFFELLNIRNIHDKTYNAHATYIHENLFKYTDKILTASVQKVKDAYPEQSNKDIFDIDVSYDGSWHKRGHTSKSGIGCVIENRTGLVVDFHCMSKYCQLCATTGEKLKAENTNKYKLWYASHKPSCNINHVGSSGSMEQGGATTMWGRSVEKCGLRYRSVVSDGDTNTIKAIHELNPYNDMTVEKMECVNHVAKRLGKALRTLVDTKKKEKITLGGRGEGRLTQEKMNKLQSYYTKAVRSNTNVDDMSIAIWATFWHCTSTDENPKHQNCPPGETSWCFYQKCLAQKKPIPPHKSHLSTYLSEEVAKHVKGVYERMTSSDLLGRCVQGKTQNVNECIHSLIWSRCPKHLFVKRPRLEVSVAVGVGEFNMGSKASRDFFASLGLEAGITMKKQGGKRDNIRIKKSERAIKTEFKKRRELRRRAETKFSEAMEQLEGGPQYLAGGADDF